MELPQVKSKQRVADHGEVYTNPREVNAMLDLVKEQSFSLSATFLEPACGNGNFLIEILRRKLRSLAEQYGKQPLAYDTHLLQVVGSIYGIDILPDNIAECRERLFNELLDTYEQVQGHSLEKALAESVRFIMQKNLICGDALTYKTADGQPIVFYEWLFSEPDFTQVAYRTFDFETTTTGNVGKQLDMFGANNELHAQTSAYKPYLKICQFANLPIS